MSIYFFGFSRSFKIFQSSVSYVIQLSDAQFDMVCFALSVSLLCHSFLS